MQYTSTSLKEVVGRIVRGTRLQDSSYLASMDEWIPEAMGLMRTKIQLVNSWEDVKINFHAGYLPCGLIHINGVEYCGRRLAYGNTSRTMSAPRPIHTTATRVAGPTPFLTIPYKREVPPGEGDYIYDATAVPIARCSTIEQCNLLPICDQWYTTSLDIINTSFADGEVRVHYAIVPHDEEGYPLIPDNENYKEAIYWYVREKMVGAGWKDEAYNTQYRDQKFELHAARAISQIRYPSVDQMEMKVNASTRFIPPADYFSSFYSTPNPEPFYGARQYGPL